MQCDLGLRLPGTVGISERRPGSNDRTYNTESLVEYEGTDIEMSLCVDENNDLKLLVSQYHMENESTGRAFHANTQLYINHADLEKLREFASFVLKFHKETPQESGA